MAFFLSPESGDDVTFCKSDNDLKAEMELNMHLRDELGAVDGGSLPFNAVLSHVRLNVRRLNEMVIFKGLG